MSDAYDFAATETMIDHLDVSREAQHLMNEVLWSNSWSPRRFARLSDAQVIDAIIAEQRRIRPSAASPQVANELWRSLEGKNVVGNLSRAMAAYKTAKIVRRVAR